MILLGDYRSYACPAADVLVTDPPYGARTHRGHDAGGPQILSATGQATRRALSYTHWTPLQVLEFVEWTRPVKGWRVCMTSHDLIPAYEEGYRSLGLYPFAPLPVYSHRPRLIGDGPCCSFFYLMVARPKNTTYSRWGCLPGEYRTSAERKAPVVGAKRVSLLEEILRDYSRPGDLVLDPCCGYGSTGIASRNMGRKFIGMEVDHTTEQLATKRLLKHVPTTGIPERARRKAPTASGHGVLDAATTL